ncbi:MAG: hypothetical protein KC620_17075, partial [Myxococcales bacterium]|nr:hypothetical protein [Myxococcales bacterium]
RVDDIEGLKRVVASGLTSGRPVLCEEFVQGLERSFEVVSVGGEPVWHSLTMYDPQPIRVVENPWIQWTVCLPREVDDPTFDDVRRAGFAALKALGQGTGLSHMEWFRRKDGSVAVSEIGARPPGARIMNLMSYAHDTDMFVRWARLMVHEEFDAPTRKFAAGAAFFRGQGSGPRIKAIHGLDDAQKAVGHLVVETSLPKVGATVSSSYEGDGYAIVKHERTDVVAEALRTLINMVRVERG